MTCKRMQSLCLFGAADDTGNLGLSALFHCMLAGVAQRAPEMEVTVFDNGLGIRGDTVSLGGRTFEYTRRGARNSRRYYRPESYANMRVSNWLGGLGNKGSQAIRRSCAVWDLSGGDSFTDLYGQKCFRTVIAPKYIALDARTPLILLPQTYGPFRHERNKKEARRILRLSTMAWARDKNSFHFMQELLGSCFDERRHFLGVDMAFALEQRKPEESPVPQAWLDHAGAPSLIGINISGLLFDKNNAEQFGLKVDYGDVIRKLVIRFLSETNVNIALIPHVVDDICSESDVVACKRLLDELPRATQERVAVSSTTLDPREVKWLIRHLDWFCGTRMHSTIAALSAGTPACALAYSPKIFGVFASCRQENHVADLRTLDSSELLDAIWASWSSRKEARHSLASTMPAVIGAANQQFDKIIEASRRPSTSSTPAG